MSGRPYSVLQPSFFLTAAGKKAKRIRFFWNSVGVEGKPKSKPWTFDDSPGSYMSGLIAPEPALMACEMSRERLRSVLRAVRDRGAGVMMSWFVDVSEWLL
jgi:hypothetical protein